MKKILVSVLAVCFVLSALSVLSFASDSDVIDLSGYDDEQIVELLKQVQEEIVSRKIEKTAKLPAADFIIGQDIPAGDYYLRKSDSASKGGNVSLGKPDAELGDHKFFDYVKSDEQYEVYVRAEDGDLLHLEIPCDLTISVGVKFE